MDQLKITPKKKQLLQQLNITTIDELLHYYPMRYNKIERTYPNQFKEGEKVAFEGVLIQAVSNRFIRGKSIQNAAVQVLETIVKIRFFNQHWLSQQLKVGKSYTFFGIVQKDYSIVVTSYNAVSLDYQLGYQSVYAKKKGLTDNDFHRYLKSALKLVVINDWIPHYLLQRYQLMNRSEALNNIHFPESESALKQAIRYLKYEEVLKFQLLIQRLNQQQEIMFKKPKLLADLDELLLKLPFKLTQDQSKALADIRSDFLKQTRMYRLLQGDVGSGKTMVAFLSMLSVDSQSALLAPTEILARQHYENFKKLNDDVVLLISKMSAKEKKQVLEKIAGGEVKHIIGTHAILQDKIQFQNLGFVVIDEQQRFGVNQRKQLLDKGEEVDVLIMSATPIPRTLALAIYNDTDISSIKQLPQGRKPVITTIVEGNSIRPILAIIEQKIAENEQVYIVCSSIEKGNDESLRNVNDVYNSFLKVSQNKYNVALLHGKMKSEEKEKIMDAFLAKKIDVLVTTTVIEVGVDVKDANVMVIYDAHRFGLSQLHQLRGRTGRGTRNGYCYLISDTQDELAKEKLNVLVRSSDGFEIAAYDLKLRGPGDVLGIRQSGVPNLVLSDLEKDQAMMEIAKEDAKYILDHLTTYPDIEAMLNTARQSLD